MCRRGTIRRQQNRLVSPAPHSGAWSTESRYLGRVFARLDMSKCLSEMYSWMDSFAKGLPGQGVAIDGKMLRGSIGRAGDTAVLNTVTAFATET